MHVPFPTDKRLALSPHPVSDSMTDVGITEKTGPPRKYHLMHIASNDALGRIDTRRPPNYSPPSQDSSLTMHDVHMACRSQSFLHGGSMNEPGSPRAEVATSATDVEAAALASLCAALASSPTRPAAPTGGPPVLLIAAGSFSPLTTAHVAMLGA